MSPETSLFVYGSLMPPSRRKELLGRSIKTTPARLIGYERRRSRYFYAVRQAGRETQGLVLLGLAASDFKTLDRYEEVPRLFTRERVEVMVKGGQWLRCWMYMPTDRVVG